MWINFQVLKTIKTSWILRNLFLERLRNEFEIQNKRILKVNVKNSRISQILSRKLKTTKLDSD